MGGALFGYDQGVISVTLVMEHFMERFPEVAEGAAGAGFKKGLLTAMIELGAFLGAMNQGWIADKFSRKWSILVAVCIFLIGSALQTGSVNYAMLVVARFVGGIGVGMLAMVAPLYISELAPPEIRGTLLVLQELSIVTAVVVAFYITYGTRYIDSDWSWRLPFLLQVSDSSQKEIRGKIRKGKRLDLLLSLADGACHLPGSRNSMAPLLSALARQQGP